MPWPIVFIGKNRRRADPHRGLRGNERDATVAFPQRAAACLIVDRFEMRFRDKTAALGDS